MPAPSATSATLRLAPRPVHTVESWYDAYAAYVAHIAINTLGRASEVEDVVQDVFVAVAHLSRRQPLADVHNPKAWLAVVCARTCMKKVRWRRWTSPLRAFDYEDLPARDASPELHTRMVEVYEALDRLPSGPRVAFAFRRILGMSLSETAQACECSVAAVKRRVRVAETQLERLRQ